MIILSYAHLLATSLVGTIDSLTVLSYILRKFLSFNWMRKYNETIFATPNTVYFKQEFLGVVNMTFKLGPANGIPLSLTFWMMCFKSHLSHLVKHHSYERLNTGKASMSTSFSDFDDLINSHISHVISWSSSTTSADWHSQKQWAQKYVHLMSLWGR